MNSILVEALAASKLSYVNIIRDIFFKTELLPLSPPCFNTNTQACVSSFQLSSVANA